MIEILRGRSKDCRSWREFCESINKPEDWLVNANLQGANLEGVNLTRANLQGADLTKTNLIKANLFCANLMGCNLTGANLTRADFMKAKLNKSNLTKANLTKTHLRDADLRGACLIEANLTMAVLTKAKLNKSNLMMANLTRADITRTNLTEANVDGANLNFTNLSGSDLFYTGLYNRKIIIYASDWDDDFASLFNQKNGHVMNPVQIQIIAAIRRSFQYRKNLTVNIFENNYFELLKYRELSPSQFKSILSILNRLGIKVDDVALNDNGEIPKQMCFVSQDGSNFLIYYSSLSGLEFRKFLSLVRKVLNHRFNKEKNIYLIPQKIESLDFLFYIMDKWGFEFTPSALDKIESILIKVWSPDDKQISLNGDNLLLTHKIDKRIYLKIKSKILGAKLLNFPGEDINRWEIKSSSLTTKGIAILQEVTDELDVYVTREVTDRLQTLSRQMRESLAASYAHDYEIQIDGLGCELKPFQRAGIVYAIRHKKTLIADEMGLGKTVEALATLEATNAFPALVICPASLKLNWLYEAKKWLINRTTTIFSENFINLDHDITIINYESLAKIMTGKGKYATPNFLFKGVILDEFHYTKNPKAARTIYSKLIAEKAEICLGLTGTPILSRPIELLSQLQIIGRIHELGGESNFKHHFCWDEDKGGYNGARNLTELNEKLRATCYIRREKDDVLKELPPKQDQIIYLELDNREEYDTAEENLIKWLLSNGMEEKAKKASNALQVVKYEYLKQLAIAGKFTSIIEWIESFLESGKKLVVFATHKGVVKNINNKFRDVSLSINGDTPQEKRQGIVNQFQDDPEIKLIVINMKTGGVGFTLTSSSDVVFCEMGWTPADHHQAEDRCHRIGQTEVVNSYYLLAPDSIDMDIYQTVMIEKLEVVTNATNGDEELRVETISVLERITTLFEERMKNKKMLQTTQHINKLEMKEV